MIFRTLRGSLPSFPAKMTTNETGSKSHRENEATCYHFRSAKTKGIPRFALRGTDFTDKVFNVVSFRALFPCRNDFL